jgi:dolichol-phosphate mannosyltransferase
MHRPAEGRKLISICVPVYNEEPNIPLLLPALDALSKTNAGYDFEFLFTDNASIDRTFELLADAAQGDQRIRVIRFSRNFGYQRSIMTNYLNARGNAAIQFDADLQDPPEMVADFLAHWERGYKVVYGIRRTRQEHPLVNFLRRRGYAFIASVSEVPVPRDAGDFRLIDRCIIDQFDSYTDKQPYLRGIIASLGYPQIGIPYDRKPRTAGVSKFSLVDVVRLGVDGVCSQSTKPLFAITMFGIWTSIIAICLAFGYSLWYVFGSSSPTPGFTTLVLLVVFSLGVNAACLGLIGEYIGRIYSNVRSGPFTVTEREIDSRLDALPILRQKNLQPRPDATDDVLI